MIRLRQKPARSQQGAGRRQARLPEESTPLHPRLPGRAVDGLEAIICAGLSTLAFRLPLPEILLATTFRLPLRETLIASALR
jgi:hypothetical protein